MRMGISCVLLALFVVGTSTLAEKPTHPAKPLPAKGDFATGIYGLTFKPPKNATYCPLPENWEGSDHGTIVFLEPPRACYGAGYPSSGRGFEPEQTPRIEIYYGYYMGDDVEKPPPCKVVGTAMLFGAKSLLCQDRSDGLTTLSISGHYVADNPAEIVVTLVSRANDLDRYKSDFLALVGSIRTCSEEWKGDSRYKKKTFVVGQGPRCPRSGWF